VATVVVVLVTGFVAPGFFLSGTSSTEMPASGPTPANPSTDVSPPSTGTDPVTVAQPVAEEFLSKVNGGDTDGATALACAGSESIISGQLLLAVEPPTSLTVGVPLGVQQMGQQLFVAFEMGGSTKQREVSGTIRLQVLEGGMACVRVLSFVGGR
jgi:hypothetical protein